jgi:imidazole glycerol-phosphate synthase subunit HisH
MIAIIDYGLGNVRAFLNVFKRLNIPARAVTDPSALDAATKIILPGVGHFDHAMERLNASGFRDTLERLVLTDARPVLGVCVGMQMLATGSEEGSQPGLGWIGGTVRAFRDWAPATSLPLPHMGWNDVAAVAQTGLFSQLDAQSRFYFLHSFFFECASQSDAIAVASYGAEFACAVQRNNIFGVQFHPEKSHHFGTRLLQNFAEL